ncbi:MAG: hypothetical protein HON68_01070 [Gammaproteobacteria bacterium]|nr:hypothetical protein [Gammaproteobacteria bacterium]MBT3490621.1 hypothetical protein [Gammaproteobacteria bacterium]MBT3718027.1 hypothetical protein [Gammaproteobacteria bacterium]MBT3844888.1 hypothetical protein [Gammaproteobacteria bacterium]MBT3891971.1 hypothetical protein [Gammaproteobacteria bacterium]
MSQITIQPPISTQALQNSSIATPLARLKVGDQLHATVMNLQNGKAELRLSEGIVSARTQVPLQTGEQLKLTVAQLQPQLTLSLSKPPPPALEAANQRLIPKQQPLQQALQNLTQLLQNSATGKGGQEAIQRVLQQLPTLMQLFNPKELKQQISKSGSFMENRLLNNRSTAPSGDLKMLLLQAKAQIMNQAENQKVVRQLDSMIARIELNQLKTLQASVQTTTQQQSEGASREPQQRNWSVEIPFIQDNQPQQIALHYRHHQEAEDEEKERWSIEINLEPPGLGGITATATHHQGELDIHFLSEKEETARLISEQIEQLQTALSVAGVEIGTLFSRQKTVNDSSLNRPPSFSSTGLSIKA